MTKTIYTVWVGLEEVAKYLDGRTAMAKANSLLHERDKESALFDTVTIELTEEEG